MSSTSSREYSRPPSVFVHSCWPCGGSPRRARTLSKPRRAHLVERGAQLVDRRADAGEVRHRLQADLVADALDDLERLAAGRAAGAVGDADEVRRERAQGRERQVQVRLALGRAGREELEGEHRAVARRVDLVDAHRAHGRAAAVKFGALMPIHGVRAVLVRPPRSPPDARQPPSKVIAAGLAAGVFLLWWPAHLPSDGVQWLVLRGLAWTLAFEVLALSFVPLERMATRAVTRRRAASRAVARAQPPGRRARAGPGQRRGDARLHRPAAARPPAPAHRPPAGPSPRRPHHAGGAQGGRAQGRARADGRGARGRSRRRRRGTPRAAAPAAPRRRLAKAGGEADRRRRRPRRRSRRRPRRRPTTAAPTTTTSTPTGRPTSVRRPPRRPTLPARRSPPRRRGAPSAARRLTRTGRTGGRRTAAARGRTRARAAAADAAGPSPAPAGRDPPALGARAVALGAPGHLQVAQVAERLAQPPVRVERRDRLAEHARDDVEGGQRPVLAQRPPRSAPRRCAISSRLAAMCALHVGERAARGPAGTARASSASTRSSERQELARRVRRVAVVVVGRHAAEQVVAGDQHAALGLPQADVRRRVAGRLARPPTPRGRSRPSTPGSSVAVGLDDRRAIPDDWPLRACGPAAQRLLGHAAERATSRRRSSAASGSSTRRRHVLVVGVHPQLAAGALDDRRRLAVVVGVRVRADEQAHVLDLQPDHRPARARGGPSSPARACRCRRARCRRRPPPPTRCSAARRATAAAGAGARRRAAAARRGPPRACGRGRSSPPPPIVA